MAIEKRCTCEEDFIDFFAQNTKAWNRLKYKSKEDMGRIVWKDLIVKESYFYNKYGYVDVVYNKESKTYSRKKAMGRPKAIKRKENRITVRLSDEQMYALERYCDKNNIHEKAQAIRIAIAMLIDNP